MEFLRRIRFIWACLCLVVAALTAVAAFGVQPHLRATQVLWTLSALVAAFSLYGGGSAWRKLSVLWLVGGGLFAAGATVNTSTLLLTQSLVFVAGAWCVVAVLMWALAGLQHKQNT